MKPRFLADRLGIMGLVVGREERVVDYFRGLLRATDKKEFSFRGIGNKIVEGEVSNRAVVRQIFLIE